MENNETTKDTVIEVAQAVIDTVENPNASNLLNDFEIAVKIVKKISSLHPSAKDIIRKMIECV